MKSLKAYLGGNSRWLIEIFNLNEVKTKKAGWFFFVNVKVTGGYFVNTFSHLILNCGSTTHPFS